jgi:hypothetical protein
MSEFFARWISCRPYGAARRLRMRTQGFVRCGGLHPGLFSCGPYGAFLHAAQICARYGWVRGFPPFP